jgi:glutamate synthase domain-containing protein 2
MEWWLIVVIVIVALVVLTATRDLTQRKHAILRNFPVIGHFRYWLEAVGPELRQYIVTDNDEERPFSRDQRRWVYATAKAENPYFGFGTDSAIDAPGYLVIKHSAFPLPPQDDHARHDVDMPGAKVIGQRHDRPHAFRPSSIVNISAMSFGSLSGAAIEALNRGAAIADVLHNTGEGGISSHHRHGGTLVYQMGTGYFGCRDTNGFSLDVLAATVESAPVAAIEIKLSQGAKPGLGGVLPGAKVTAEIAAARGVSEGQTVVSPNHHAEFDDVDSMIDFIEVVAERTGLPVGIKSAVGDQAFWDTLAARIRCHRHRFRSGRFPRRVPLGDRARGRPRQRGPRGDAGHRLRAGPAMPHRALPHGRGHPVEVAGPWPRPDLEGCPIGQLRHGSAP